MRVQNHTRDRRLLAALAASFIAGCAPATAPVPESDTPPVAAAPGVDRPAAAAASTSVSKNAAEPADDSPPAYEASTLGLSLQPVEGFSMRRDFTPRYLMPATWKAFAAPDEPGTPHVALVLDGSNEVTAAELHIGSSDAVDAVAHCRDLPPEAVDAGAPAEIDGQAFLRFHAGDAAMSHRVSVESYRAERRGRCLAIDLVVSGTPAEIYDPPRQPPFAREAAEQRLHEALRAIRLR